ISKVLCAIAVAVIHNLKNSSSVSCCVRRKGTRWHANAHLQMEVITQAENRGGGDCRGYEHRVQARTIFFCGGYASKSALHNAVCMSRKAARWSVSGRY